MVRAVCDYYSTFARILTGINASQLVPVQPQTEYDFECYVATEKLETGSAPQIQILDANTGAVLFDFADGAGRHERLDPRQLVVQDLADKTEAVMLKIVRVSCGTRRRPVCPIFGSVWYDDFTLKRRN